jgi:hypothetical protein
VGEALERNPITGNADGCAKTANGVAIIPPPTTPMKSRRLNAAPEVHEEASYRLKRSLKGPDVRFGSKADICGAKQHVRFSPDFDSKG